MTVRFQKLDPRAVAPRYGSTAAAGADLYAVGDAEELIGVGTGRTTLYNVGESITACDLTANGIAGEMYDCCVLPEAGLLVGGMYENGAFRLYVSGVRPVAADGE